MQAESQAVQELQDQLCSNSTKKKMSPALIYVHVKISSLRCMTG